MPEAVFEVGTEIVADDEQVPTPGWTDSAGISGVFRQGRLVDVSLRVTNIVRKAYSAGTTYAAKELATEGGNVYESLAAGNIGKTPSTSPAAWKLLGKEKTICTLSSAYRPAAVVKLASGFEVLTNGEVVSTATAGALEAAVAYTVECTYLAAAVSP